MSILEVYKNRKKVLGLNERGLNYIRKYNKVKAIRIADNKLLTKDILNKSGIPTPNLIAVINDYDELKKFDWEILPKSFVIKPVSGLEGGGIDIFYNRDNNGRWIRANKSRVSVADLKKMAKSILDGRYSLYNLPDKIMFEERIKTHKSFKYYTYKGAPDVRVIVFNNIPVMAMLRLPTRQSEGKANLDKGALGLGIDMATGTTTSGIHGKAGRIEFVPGTHIRTRGLKVPYWNKILHYAIEAQRATSLNFAAIDFLIDREFGPVIVELNARPGLSIQLANDDGMRWRLRKAESLKVNTIEKGMRLAKDLFGGEIEEEVESVSGKEVVGIYENIRLIGRNLKEVVAKAKIDTGADSTSIDTNLALELGFKDIIDEMESKNIPADLDRETGIKLMEQLGNELMPKYPDLVDVTYVKSSHGASVRPSIRLVLKIKDTQFETKATIFDRSKLTYPVIIGRKSLFRFLIDPSKINLKK
jgi:alpha-L-glutamate ligase-like protein